MSWALNGRRVPVEQIRPAILQVGLTNREIAERAGMTESGVRALLGMKPSINRTGEIIPLATPGLWHRVYGPYYGKTLTYDCAVKLVRAAGLDPVDVGL